MDDSECIWLIAMVRMCRNSTYDPRSRKNRRFGGGSQRGNGSEKGRKLRHLKRRLWIACFEGIAHQYDGTVAGQ